MKSRMPTRLRYGEGRAGGGSNRHVHPSWSAGVVGTARWKSDTGNLGRPGGDEGRALKVPFGVGQGHMSYEAG